MLSTACGSCPSTASKCKKRWETTSSGVSGVRFRPVLPSRSLPGSPRGGRRFPAGLLCRCPRHGADKPSGPLAPPPEVCAESAGWRPDHQGADERSDRTNRPASGLRPAARSQTGRKPVKRHGLPPREARSLGPEEAAARSYGPHRLFGRHREGHDIARGLELLHAAIQIVFGQKSASEFLPDTNRLIRPSGGRPRSRHLDRRGIG